MKVFWRFITLSFLCVSLLVGCSLFFPDVEVMVINQSTSIITGLYAKEATSEEWESNLIDAELLPEVTAAIYLPKGIYDFKIIFADCDPSYAYNIDLTKIEIYTLRIDGEIP